MGLGGTRHLALHGFSAFGIIWELWDYGEVPSDGD